MFWVGLAAMIQQSNIFVDYTIVENSLEFEVAHKDEVDEEITEQEVVDNLPFSL